MKKNNKPSFLQYLKPHQYDSSHGHQPPNNWGLYRTLDGMWIVQPNLTKRQIKEILEKEFNLFTRHEEIHL